MIAVPMKIGIDARNFIHQITGIGRYTLELSRSLAKLGCEIYLYIPEMPHDGLPKIDGVKWRISNCRGAILRTFWGQCVLPVVANKDNLDVFWGPAHRLPRILKLKAPKVLTIHDLVWQKYPETMRLQTFLGERLQMESSLKQADSITVVSNATGLDVSSQYPWLLNPLEIIYPGVCSAVDGDKEARETKNLPDEFILFVGTLEPRKNLERLLQAFSKLDGNLKLVIAGGKGWGQQSISSLIEAYSLKDKVQILGYVSDNDLQQLYKRARFLAMPSLYEGFGLPIIEAMAQGTPVLTSNNSSMPEVSGAGAVLVDPHDESSILSGLEKLSHDESFLTVLSKNALENAERFKWEKSAMQLMALFEKTIKCCGKKTP